MTSSAPGAADWNSDMIALLVIGSTLWFGEVLLTHGTGVHPGAPIVDDRINRRGPGRQMISRGAPGWSRATTEDRQYTREDDSTAAFGEFHNYPSLIQLPPNDGGQARRANDVRYGTEAVSRRCLHHAC